MTTDRDLLREALVQLHDDETAGESGSCIVCGYIRHCGTMFPCSLVPLIQRIEARLAEPVTVTDAQVLAFDKAMQDHWDAWVNSVDGQKDPRPPDQVRLDSIRFALTNLLKP